MALLMLSLAIFLSFKAVSKPRKYSKKQLTSACILAVFSVIIGQIPNMINGALYLSPILIIAVICIIANAILQKKNIQKYIQQKKDATPAPVAVAESNAENLKGKVLFDSVETSEDAVITVTDEGFRYVGKATRAGSRKKIHVDEFIEYPQIVEFKQPLGVYNIIDNRCTYIFTVDKDDEEAIEYIHQRFMQEANKRHQRFMQEQNKPHIMKCNICGQIFTYTAADINKQKDRMSAAASAMNRANLTSLTRSQLLGSVEAGNAKAMANNARAQLDALTRCPNCRSKDATEITAEEAAKIRAASAAPVQAASSADELKKFKELLDSGIITQEEFDAKKKQFLGL